MGTNSTAASYNIPDTKTFNYKWLLGLIMVTVIALGWKYPLLGFVVPIAMTSGILGGFFRGRWVCGNACPRGGFLDTWFNLVSGKRTVPEYMNKRIFRWTVLSILMSTMVFRLSQNLSDIYHWGFVFWQMCLITTIVAIILGLRYNARSWCFICPVGTIAGTAGGRKYALQVSSACKVCGRCETSCPMQLAIASYRDTGNLAEKDCLKCSSCITACPRSDVLSWPINKAA